MTMQLSDVQKILDWLKVKLHLSSIAGAAAARTVHRGQVYRCNFGIGVGSEMQKDRPAVIVQNNIGNIRSTNTIVVPITHGAGAAPYTVPIAARHDSDGNLLLDGSVNASNLMCVSKARLGNHICNLSAAEMRAVDEALSKMVGLMHYYSDLQSSLHDKLAYMERIKRDRNAAQDELAAIRALLQLEKEDSIQEKIKNLLETIDNA